MERCTRHPACVAGANQGHYCPASPEQLRAMGYRPSATVSPFVRRALARELPASETMVGGWTRTAR